ncbi:prenyltransferase/squalene oxidase repeat-containing protein [Kibdelosporangium lantanae]|uniref:Prenyltransferase/squalene oxidase repeat-containing protein n=1 Tax=Kibdelosporangium lantanae TaxID=1497396 RepID=A0ABW3M2J2_9PSEU
MNWLAGAQAADGGFGDDYTVVEGTDPSLTAYVVHGVRSLQATETQSVISGCERYIATSQRSSGAWSAWFEAVDSIEGTAAALRVLMASKDDHSSAIKKGLEYLDNTSDLQDLENWIIVTLTYVAVGRAKT